MFTGIVEEVGRVEALAVAPGLTRLTVRAPLVAQGAQTGASIAVNGACLTVVAYDEATFSVEATLETLRRTNLGGLREGDGVHLERALAADGRIGGHFVQGHVDGVGRILARRPEGDSVVATFGAPGEVLPYLVPKGSVAVDGVSLTVVDVLDQAFTVALIPHTLEMTLLGEKPIGSAVNLEADILAKYVARAYVYAPAAEPRSPQGEA